MRIVGIYHENDVVGVCGWNAVLPQCVVYVRADNESLLHLATDGHQNLKRYQADEIIVESLHYLVTKRRMRHVLLPVATFVDPDAVSQPSARVGLLPDS